MPEQAFAWDQILVWSIQAGVADFHRLWDFMRSNGMDLERKTELQARWDGLIASWIRFESGEKAPHDR